MASYFEGLFNRRAMPALAAAMSFAHARHGVIAENIANMSTPGYKAKRLDMDGFQRALGRALVRHGDDPNKPFTIESKQARSDGRGHLTVNPSVKPGRNLVFHDGTNLSIEREMSDLAANAMWHEMTTTLLRGRFEALHKAIRGRS